FFFFQAEDGIRDFHVTGVQTCALPICMNDSSFVPLLERTELDLVEQLAFLPGSGELAVLCSAYRGSFPRSPMLVLVNPDGNRTRVVHADAPEGRILLLDNGDLLLRTEERRSFTWLM